MWEAVAILVGLRAWRELLCPSGGFEVRSDSLGALGATLRGSARSPRLNVVIAEIMLDEAELSTRIEVLEHIPGVSNVWPDALSRLGAPEPKQFPEALALVRRTTCPIRGTDFWIAQRLPAVPSWNSLPPSAGCVLLASALCTGLGGAVGGGVVCVAGNIGRVAGECKYEEEGQQPVWVKPRPVRPDAPSCGSRTHSGALAKQCRM